MCRHLAKQNGDSFNIKKIIFAATRAARNENIYVFYNLGCQNMTNYAMTDTFRDNVINHNLLYY